MANVLNPYHDWLGLKPSSTDPNHYELLGLVEFEDDLKRINGAYYRCVAKVSIYQNGAQELLCKQVLEELSAARDCLADSQLR